MNAQTVTIKLDMSATANQLRAAADALDPPRRGPDSLDVDMLKRAANAVETLARRAGDHGAWTEWVAPWLRDFAERVDA